MFSRYAVFYTLLDDPLAALSASWLGWDATRGVQVNHPEVDGLDIAAVTASPRKYGVHGTIKPPFILTDGKTEAELANALDQICKSMPPIMLDQLKLTTLGRFLALCAIGDTAPLGTLAARVVRGLDIFRAPMTQDDIVRRRSANLSPSQEQNLVDWGYPYVMDDFRFHMTLTGKLDKPTLIKANIALEKLIAPLLRRPFIIDSLTLVGQRSDGMFVEIRRYPLAP